MKIIKIHNLTYYLILMAFLCGYIKRALIILFIIIIHELGHVILIKLFGYHIKSITIYPFGGITKIEKDLNSPLKEDLLISIAGVFIQCILFIIPSIELHKYNLSIILFNLLPIIPLDGSYILLSFLNKLFSYQKAYNIYLIISLISIILYILFNYWYSLNNYLLVILFIIKTYETFKNKKYNYNRFLLERYLHNYPFKYLSTKKGNLNILKKDTYQYFKENNKIISEKKKLKEMFEQY